MINQDILKLVNFACLHGAYTALVDAGITPDENIEHQATLNADRVCGMLACAIESDQSIEDWLRSHGFAVDFCDDDQAIWNGFKTEYEATNGPQA